MNPYTPRGRPTPPTGVPAQQTQAIQLQTRRRTEEQIQLPAQGPSAATGGQTPQSPQGQASQRTEGQTSQITVEGTPPHDQQQSADKRSKKPRVAAVTASVNTTAGSSKR